MVEVVLCPVVEQADGVVGGGRYEEVSGNDVVENVVEDCTPGWSQAFGGEEESDVRVVVNDVAYHLAHEVVRR